MGCFSIRPGRFVHGFLRKFLSKARGLCYTAIFHNSTYKAMKIVLNNKTPTAVLRIAPVNIGGDLLPAIDESTGKPTLAAGSIGITFDTDDVPVDVARDPADESRVTFTKKGSAARLIRATAVAANEDGEIVRSAPLEIEIQSDGVAAGLVWLAVDAQTAAAVVATGTTAAVVTGAAVDKKDESQG